ncbi:Uncharacterised protein [uncultured Flavonifractor sp.]|nr:Uncharacterised protein [uncultured Flavonifractor sp.]
MILDIPHAAVGGVAVDILDGQLGVDHLDAGQILSGHLEHHAALQPGQFHLGIVQDQLAAVAIGAVIQNEAGAVVIAALSFGISSALNRQLHAVQGQSGVLGDRKGAGSRTSGDGGGDGGDSRSILVFEDGDILADGELGAVQSGILHQIDVAAVKLRISQSGGQLPGCDGAIGHPDGLVVLSDNHADEVRQMVGGPGQGAGLIGGGHRLQLAIFTHIVNHDTLTIGQFLIIGYRNGDLALAGVVLSGEHGVAAGVNGGHGPAATDLLLHGQGHAAAIGLLGDGVPGILVQGNGAHVGDDIHIDLGRLNGGQSVVVHRYGDLLDVFVRSSSLAGGHIYSDRTGFRLHLTVSFGSGFSLVDREVATDSSGGRGAARRLLYIGHHAIGGLYRPEALRRSVFLGSIAGGNVGFGIRREGAADDGNAGSVRRIISHSLHCVDSRIRGKCTTGNRNFGSFGHTWILCRTVKYQSGTGNYNSAISDLAGDISGRLKLAAGDGDSSSTGNNASSAGNVKGTTGNCDLILPGGIDTAGNITRSLNAAIEGTALDVDHIGITSPVRSVTRNNRIIRGAESAALNGNRCASREPSKYCTLHRFKLTRLNRGGRIAADPDCT